MAELADAPDLGSGSERSEGSSPFIRTRFNPWCVNGLSLMRTPPWRFSGWAIAFFLKLSPMSEETKSVAQSTTGADAIDVAIASGIDFDGSPIPQAKLDLYEKVMGLEAGRQRSGVSNTMRSRIVRIGVKHLPQAELDQMLIAANFAPLKDKEVAFYYGGK